MTEQDTAAVELDWGMFQGAEGLDEAQLRPCGSCAACCHCMKIPELQKPPAQDCRHLIPLRVVEREEDLVPGRDCGCRVYAERPESCRVFVCLWKAGFIKSEGHRPDRLGITFSVQTDTAFAPMVIVAHENYPDASRQPEARRVMEAVARRTLLLVFQDHLDHRYFMGPERQVQRALAVVEQVKERLGLGPRPASV
jgi:hypothetical protein